MVGEDQPTDLHAHELAAELGADRAACAGHEHGAAAHVRADRRRVELHGLSPEDVLDLHRPQLGDEVVVAVDEIVHVRQRLDRDPGLPAGRDHRGPLAAAGRGQRDVHLVGLARLEDLRQIVRRAEHLHALKAVAQLVAVVVDQPDRLVARQSVAEHLAQDQVAGVTGAHDQHLLALRDERATARAFQQGTRQHACATEKDQREDEVEHEGALGWRALTRLPGREAGRDRVLLDLPHATLDRRVAVGRSELRPLSRRGLRVDDHAARELDDREDDEEHDRRHARSHAAAP